MAVRVSIARGSIVVAVVALLVLGSSLPSSAAWNDREQAGATVTAATLEPPTITSCVTRRSGVIVRITWQFPTGGIHDGLGAQDVVFFVDGQVAVPETSGPVDGTYTSTFRAGLLGSILGSILGAAFDIEVASTAGPWTSTDTARGDVFIPLLLGNGTCTVTNPA